MALPTFCRSFDPRPQNAGLYSRSDTRSQGSDVYLFSSCKNSVSDALCLKGMLNFDFHKQNHHHDQIHLTNPCKKQRQASGTFSCLCESPVSCSEQFQRPDYRFCAAGSADTGLRAPADFREALLMSTSPTFYSPALISTSSNATRQEYNPTCASRQPPLLRTDTYAARLTATPSASEATNARARLAPSFNLSGYYKATGKALDIPRLHVAAGTCSDSLARISVCNLVW